MAVTTYKDFRVLIFPKKLGIGPDNLFTASDLQETVHSFSSVEIIDYLILRMKRRRILHNFQWQRSPFLWYATTKIVPSKITIDKKRTMLQQREL